MVLLSYLFSVLACTALYPAFGTVSARQINKNHVRALQREAANRFNTNRLAVGNVQLSASVKNITFSNPAASGECHLARVICIVSVLIVGVAFYVDGTTIPDVDWDVGPSWAGLLPISGDKNETRKVRKRPPCVLP